MATNTAHHAEALDRATRNQSWSNYPAIFQGFTAMGIAEDDIRPRENVFTFNAWKALGRSVKKGEHGVRVVTWVDYSRTVVENGEEVTKSGRAPKTTVVFHISQTELTSEREARYAQRRTGNGEATAANASAAPQKPGAGETKAEASTLQAPAPSNAPTGPVTRPRAKKQSFTASNRSRWEER